MKRLLVSVGYTLASMSLSGVAQAGINGTSVNLTAYYPDLGSVYADAGAKLVGPDVEFPYDSVPGYRALSFDLSDTRIAVCCNAVFADAAFNGFAFTFSSVVPTGASIDPASAYAPYAISLIGNTLFLNYQGVVNATKGPSLIDLQFGAVPEPAEWELMIAGLLAAGVALRNKRVAVGTESLGLD